MLDTACVALAIVAALLLAWPELASIFSRVRGTMTGPEGMVGERGVFESDGDGEGWAVVRGERWRVASSESSELRSGQPIEVTRVEGLRLAVRPAGPSSGRSGPRPWLSRTRLGGLACWGVAAMLATVTGPSFLLIVLGVPAGSLLLLVGLAGLDLLGG